MKPANLLFYCFILFTTDFLKAQEIAIGEWRDHLSYKNAIAVAEGNGKVYCATESGIFSYTLKDNSLERLSKITGLSDVEASTVGFNKYNNVLLIAYKNANIDLIENGSIINLADIKRKPIPGNKSINAIYFINEFAYLSCGFGIVVLDTKKKEIKDTYYIGTNGSSINVRDITSDGNNLFAATDTGVYTASLNSNLTDFNSWKKFNGLPEGIFNTITFFNGKIYTNYSKNSTIFVYDNISWNYFPQQSGYNVLFIKAFNDNLVVVKDANVEIYDIALSIISNVYSYGFDYPQPKQAVLDQNNYLWIADSRYGLIKNWNTWSSESYFPDGPPSSNVHAMSLAGNNLWVAPGGITNSWNNLYNTEGIFSFTDNNWTVINGNKNPAMDTIFDIVCIMADPANSNHVYAGTWSRGLLEFDNGNLTTIYKETNSSLQSINLPNYYGLRVGGITFDKNKHLWVTNSEVSSILSVKKNDGTWKSFDFSAFVTSSVTVGNILIDKSDQKWIVLPRGGGIIVYKGGETETPDTSNTKKLSTAAGNGALPSSGIYSIAEDLDGEIWVGTDKGIAVFYSPEAIFQNGNWDSRQILIEQDGHVQLLLETEIVTAILVDGANRKWVGTEKSGVFLMSADGTKQIYHFDEENSPLFSNNIISIAINHLTGEVFFGTSKGIISFKNTATEGGDEYKNVYAYPNPVRENYEGNIAIKGLVKNANVKITDISGTLIYETQAEGGQATWNGRNFKGEKAHTGVYLVFCSNEDGSKTFVTKILIIN